MMFALFCCVLVPSPPKTLPPTGCDVAPPRPPNKPPPVVLGCCDCCDCCGCVLPPSPKPPILAPNNPPPVVPVVAGCDVAVDVPSPPNKLPPVAAGAAGLDPKRPPLVLLLRLPKREDIATWGGTNEQGNTRCCARCERGCVRMEDAPTFFGRGTRLLTSGRGWPGTRVPAA